MLNDIGGEAALGREASASIYIASVELRLLPTEPKRRAKYDPDPDS
jgi:hypothetical protein